MKTVQFRTVETAQNAACEPRGALQAAFIGAPNGKMPVMATGPDARLLILAAQLELAFAAWREPHLQYQAAFLEARDDWKREVSPAVRHRDDVITDILGAPSLVALSDNLEPLLARMEDVIRSIRSAPAKSISDLAIKARAMEIDIHSDYLSEWADRDSVDRQNADHGLETMMNFTDELRCMAAD